MREIDEEINFEFDSIPTVFLSIVSVMMRISAAIVVLMLVRCLHHVTVDGNVNGVWMRHRHFDAFDHFDRIWFLDFDGIGLFNGVRHRFFDELRDDLVDRNLDGLLNGHMNWIRLRSAGENDGKIYHLQETRPNRWVPFVYI